MNTMDQLLGNVGIDTSQSLLLSKVFLLVLAVLLFNFLVRKLFSRLALQLQKLKMNGMTRCLMPHVYP